MRTIRSIIITGFWALLFIALALVFVCRQYWPVLPFMLVAYNSYERSMKNVRLTKGTRHENI